MKNLYESQCEMCIYNTPKEVPGEEPDGLCRRLPYVSVIKKKERIFYTRISTLNECPGGRMTYAEHAELAGDIEAMKRWKIIERKAKHKMIPIGGKR